MRRRWVDLDGSLGLVKKWDGLDYIGYFIYIPIGKWSSCLEQRNDEDNGIILNNLLMAFHTPLLNNAIVPGPYIAFISIPSTLLSSVFVPH